MTATKRGRLGACWAAAWALLVLCPCPVLGTAEGRRAPVRAEPVAPGVAWEGPQFLGADAKGRVFVLDGASWRVYQVRGGDLRESEVLEPLEDQGPPRHAIGAALSPAGDAWLVQDFGGSSPLRLFRAGKEVPVPDLDWRVSSVGWSGDAPVVAVVPLRGGAPLGREADPELPVLLELDRHRWETRFGERIDLEERSDPVGQLLVTHDFLVTPAGGDDSSVWMAQRNVYRVRKISAGGVLRTELVVGEGEVEYREPTELDQTHTAELLAAARKAGHTVTGSPRARPVVQQAIDALAVGADGRLYVLRRPKGDDDSGLLDRYDPVRGVLERTEVSIPPYSGRRTMVAGRDGLYVADYQASSGRWRIPWVRLDEADWQPVPGATVR